LLGYTDRMVVTSVVTLEPGESMNRRDPV
jgi:hypothetical protein